MTTLARSAESLAVPEIVPVADARMPTYTVEARNSRFMAGSMMSTSKGLVVVAPGVTGPFTLNAGVPVYTVLFRLSKYTANVTLPVPLAFTKSTEPMNRTVSTTDELPRPRDRTVCTGMVSGTPGGSGLTAAAVGCGEGRAIFDIDVFSFLSGAKADTLPYVGPLPPGVPDTIPVQNVRSPGLGSSSVVDTVRFIGSVDFVNAKIGRASCR